MKNDAFVMYSWDGSDHQEWVKNLVDTLRIKDGIDATFDKYEIQGGIVNLKRMMVENISSKEWLIIVGTKEYADKADKELGGVGFETNLLMEIVGDPQLRGKVLFLNRHNGDWKETIPNYLKGFTFIDMSDSNYKKGYDNLVRTITNQPEYVKPELGTARRLRSKEIESLNLEESNFEIPDLTPVTSSDKENFIKESFNMMIKVFREGFEAISSKNSNFTYKITDNVTHVNIKIALDNNEIKNMNFWIGTLGGLSDKKDSISFQHANRFNTTFSPNSMNGYINVEISPSGELFLKNQMSFYSNDRRDRESIINDLFRNEFLNPLKSYHQQNMVTRY